MLQEILRQHRVRRRLAHHDRTRAVLSTPESRTGVPRAPSEGLRAPTRGARAEALPIVYLDEHGDARETAERVEAEGTRCLSIAGDIREPSFCAAAVAQTVDTFGRLDALVNDAAVQYDRKRLADISDEQLEQTFRTNVAFTRSLASNLADAKIRVNAVAPGPIWTPLIPASFDAEKVAEFGTDQALGRAGQPEEVAPSYVFLASRDSSYITGQTIHPNGGEIIGG